MSIEFIPTPSVFHSEAHYHDWDASCLEPVESVPVRLGDRGKGVSTDEVAVGPGWFRCTRWAADAAHPRAYYVHDHDGHYVSHFPRDTARCPR